MKETLNIPSNVSLEPLFGTSVIDDVIGSFRSGALGSKTSFIFATGVGFGFGVTSNAISSHDITSAVVGGFILGGVVVGVSVNSLR